MRSKDCRLRSGKEIFTQSFKLSCTFCRFYSRSRCELLLLLLLLLLRTPLLHGALCASRCSEISFIKASWGASEGAECVMFAPAFTKLDMKSTGAPSVLRDSSKSDPTFSPFFFSFTHVTITLSHSSSSSSSSSSSCTHTAPLHHPAPSPPPPPPQLSENIYGLTPDFFLIYIY